MGSTREESLPPLSSSKSRAALQDEIGRVEELLQRSQKDAVAL
jgi:hypothetical protein